MLMLVIVIDSEARPGESVRRRTGSRQRGAWSKIIRAGRHAASARSKGGCCPELSGRFRFPLLALSRDPRGRVEPGPRLDPNRYVRELACCPGNGRWQPMALPPACRWEKCPAAS